MFFLSGPWYGRIAVDVLIDCTWYRTVFHLRSGRSSHFENLAGRKVRFGEDCCAAVEVCDTIPVLVAFCDLAAFEKILVAVAFGLDTCNRGLLLIFGNNPAVVGIDLSNGDNLLAVAGF